MSQYLEKSKRYKGFHYSVLKPEMLDYLHGKTLEMLEVIIPIFDAHHIQYMICGGTLLGAVTIGRFIPWDDDLDICVLDEDYDKMQQVLLNELPDWMLLQCKETEPHYYHGWMKLRDKRSHVYPDEGSYECNGVWIDLYRLTKMKKKNINHKIQQEHMDYLLRRRTRGGISTVELFRRICRNHLIFKAIKSGLESGFSRNRDSCCIIWSASKIVLETDWVLPRRTYCFEGIELYSFSEADKYLIRHYGEHYHELPPDDLRRVGINRIDIL